MNREAPRNRAEIHPEDLYLLEKGEMETRTLVDGLAINFRTLLATLDLNPEAIDLDSGLLTRMSQAGRIIFEAGPESMSRAENHKSDTMRGFVCYALMMNPESLESSLEKIRGLADDHHFGVREWAWLALRPQIVNEPEKALKLFEPWVLDSKHNIRRFACEATRPRGVWCKQIPELIQKPELALGLLDPMATDESKYVQLSIGNWLNDASKKRADFVLETTKRWQETHSSPATAKIVKRALRTLNK